MIIQAESLLNGKIQFTLEGLTFTSKVLVPVQYSKKGELALICGHSNSFLGIIEHVSLGDRHLPYKISRVQECEMSESFKTWYDTARVFFIEGGDQQVKEIIPEFFI